MSTSLQPSLGLSQFMLHLLWPPLVGQLIGIQVDSQQAGGKNPEMNFQGFQSSDFPWED